LNLFDACFLNFVIFRIPLNITNFFDKSDEINIEIYNSIGTPIYQTTDGYFNKIINIAAFSTGIYLMKIQTNNTNFTQKLIKQ